jgi:PAS domain S-box-containing protein
MGIYLGEAIADVFSDSMKILMVSIFFLVLILLVSIYILRRAAAVERKRREAVQALAENEARLQNITAAARDAIIEMGPDGRISFWNPAAEKLTGYSTAEAMGKNLHQLVVPPEYIDRHNKAFRVFQETGQGPAIGKTTRWEIITKSGGSTPVELSLSTPLKVNDGWRTVGILRDISDRIDAERTLRESEFRFRTFFNSNPEGIVLLDFNGTILDVNNALVRMSGYPLSEIVHNHFSKFIPQPYHAVTEKAVQAIRSGRAGHDSPAELIFSKKEGAGLPIAVKGWLIVDENNTPVSLGAFVRDLTREKHLAEEKIALEKQLRQAQKIEAIGTLAGGIAHDFNNILGGIIGYTELALVNESSAEDKKTSTYLHHILTAGNRAKELVQQILRFSRRDESSLSNIRITPVLEESIKLLRSTLPATIAIEHHFRADLDRITGDSTQIHQIIMNLCTNAYHAMRPVGGRLTVSLQNILLKQPKAFMSLKIPPGEYVQLSVADTGHGIAPHVIERIFEPYFTTKKINEGTGLGLSVILGIVRKHHGLIEVASKPGEGTRFDIFFPLVHARIPERRTLEDTTPQGKGEQVLVVDDEQFCRDVIKDSLEHLGYRVNVQESSRKALETFRQTPGIFDLMVTDQTMPELTGVQLIEAVRQYNKTIPVILCTGFSETVTEQSARHYGINKFIMKPVNIKDLARAAHEALAMRAA